MEDIREKTHISHEDVMRLNFIRKNDDVFFRKYHQQGMRSQVVEVLGAEDVNIQNKGIIIDGIRRYPWAEPQRILRIFRQKFDNIDEVIKETKTVKLIEKYLDQTNMAYSEEFIVDYDIDGQKNIILCGFQRYVQGEIINPWDLTTYKDIINKDIINEDIIDEENNNLENNNFENRINAGRFISKIKKLIKEEGYIPDLCGDGNLIRQNSEIVLVDINNITRIIYDDEIHLDDKGYPAADKSIEVLNLLEKCFMKGTDFNERYYKHFLTKERMKKVVEIQNEWYKGIMEKY